MANISTYLADKLLDHALGTAAYTEPTVYVALYTTTPTMPAGTGGVEVSSGSYARVEATGSFAAASGGSAASNADIDFATATADWGDIVGVGLVDASTGGNILMAGNLTETKTVSSGDTFSLPSGDLTDALS